MGPRSRCLEAANHFQGGEAERPFARCNKCGEAQTREPLQGEVRGRQKLAPRLEPHRDSRTVHPSIGSNHGTTSRSYMADACLWGATQATAQASPVDYLRQWYLDCH